MGHEVASSAVAAFLVDAARELGGFDSSRPITALDFGCGQGGLVRSLRERGLEVRGCDLEASLEPDAGLDAIAMDPYRLPYADGSFDLVVSTSVFEHAQNTVECFAEIRRVLRPGGMAIHGFPGKWYLPTEPHIYVPLVNWFWPRVPRLWLALWALLGVRNDYQEGQAWREVARLNEVYVRDRLCYRTSGAYERLSDRTFGNHEWAMPFYIQHGPGRGAALARRLPFKALTGRILREFRIGYLVQRRG